MVTLVFKSFFHVFKDPPTCSFILSDSPSGLNFTCSLWYSSVGWNPRLNIKGPGIERYTGDPGVKTLSQEVQPDHEGMMYECGAVFEWSDFCGNSQYDQTTLPVITETCSNEVKKSNSYTISSSMAPSKVTRKATRSMYKYDVQVTASKGSSVSSKKYNLTVRLTKHILIMYVNL